MMNEDLMKEIFPDLLTLIQEGKCPFCRRDIDFEEFKDELSRKEFAISGLCQRCQNSVFKNE